MVLACQALSMLRVRAFPEYELDEGGFDAFCKTLLKDEGCGAGIYDDEELTGGMHEVWGRNT